MFIDDGVRVWAHGESSNFQLVRGPQNWVCHFQAGAVWHPIFCWKLCRLWSCPFICTYGLEIATLQDSYLTWFLHQLRVCTIPHWLILWKPLASLVLENCNPADLMSTDHLWYFKHIIMYGYWSYTLTHCKKSLLYVCLPTDQDMSNAKLRKKFMQPLLFTVVYFTPAREEVTSLTLLVTNSCCSFLLEVIHCGCCTLEMKRLARGHCKICSGS